MALVVVRRIVVLALVAIAALAWTGCDSGGDATPPPPTTTSSVATTATTVVAADAAPAELQGRWRTTLANGDDITFTVSASTFQIRRGPAANGGSLHVQGDTMTLTTPSCEGEGEYRWQRDGDRLTITMVGEDPCPNRSDAIAGAVFTAEG